MRINNINNTSQMFTVAKIDFVQYILWCCPAVAVAYSITGVTNHKCFIQLYFGGEGYAGSSSPYLVLLLKGIITENAMVFYVNRTAKS